MTSLLPLAARVEALDGPDREVDAEIMFDLFASPVGKHKVDGGPVGYIRPDEQPSWNFGLRFPGKDRDWFHACRTKMQGETLLIERDSAYVLMNSLRIPTLTASIDAVADLITEKLPGWGHGYTLGPGHLRTTGRVSRPPIAPEAPIIDGRSWAQHFEASAATPALALLAAALRALASQENRK